VAAASGLGLNQCGPGGFLLVRDVACHDGHHHPLLAVATVDILSNILPVNQGGQENFHGFVEKLTFGSRVRKKKMCHLAPKESHLLPNAGSLRPVFFFLENERGDLGDKLSKGSRFSQQKKKKKKKKKKKEEEEKKEKKSPKNTFLPQDFILPSLSTLANET